jgi:NAD(P)-dependent dehydrogenase (short-subunit alcohol dehydrogenase family)
MKDKVIIVTGGSAGIGRAIALRFAKENAKIVVADISDNAGQETVKLIEEAGGTGHFIHCDVGQPKQVESLIRETVDKFGRLDYGINNAGIEGEQAPTAQTTLENFDKVIQINLRGTWLCMKYELQYMLEQESECAIVNISSIAGKIGFPYISAYDASKHGVLGLTKTAALEYAEQNIRVNAVCPGVIETDMIERFTGGDESVRKQLTDPDPMKRMGQPEEIADAAYWLCSNQSSYVTGHALVVDGGWVIQ